MNCLLFPILDHYGRSRFSPTSARRSSEIRSRGGTTIAVSPCVPPRAHLWEGPPLPSPRGRGGTTIAVSPCMSKICRTNAALNLQACSSGLSSDTDTNDNHSSPPGLDSNKHGKAKVGEFSSFLDPTYSYVNFISVHFCDRDSAVDRLKLTQKAPSCTLTSRCGYLTTASSRLRECTNKISL